jgi:hypothetical protein
MGKCVCQHPLELFLNIAIAKVVNSTYFRDSNCQEVIVQVLHLNLNKFELLKAATKSLSLHVRRVVKNCYNFLE